MNILQQLEAEQMSALRGDKPRPDFRAGDTVKVNVKVVEVDLRRKVQAEQDARAPPGLRRCMHRALQAPASTRASRCARFPTAKASNACSRSIQPLVDSVQVVRKGKVRRAKLYYLRGRRGKSARIVERQDRASETAGA